MRGRQGLTRGLAGVLMGLALAAGGVAIAQSDVARESAELRATGLVGEQPDGYLHIVGNAPAAIRQRVDAVNIQRRAFYTELAQRRRAQIEEVAATAACEILATRVQPGQYYRTLDGRWHQREGNAPVERPAYCG